MAAVPPAPSSVRAVGRPRVSSRDEIERVAFALFARQGFEATTVDDIAAAAGISRRSFFRYFRSKNDVVWGRFDDGLRHLAAALERSPRDRPMPSVLRREIVEFNRVPAEQVPLHRQRMSLILTVPDLQAYSTLRYAAWREVVSAYVATRTGAAADDLLPRLAGHLMLGAAVAAYEQWLGDETADLQSLLDEALRTTTAALPPTR